MDEIEFAEESKIKSLAKKYWKPATAAAAALAAVGTAVVYLRTRNEYDVTYDITEPDTSVDSDD